MGKVLAQGNNNKQHHPGTESGSQWFGSGSQANPKPLLLLPHYFIMYFIFMVFQNYKIETDLIAM